MGRGGKYCRGLVGWRTKWVVASALSGGKEKEVVDGNREGLQGEDHRGGEVVGESLEGHR